MLLVIAAPSVTFAQSGPVGGIVPCGYGTLPSCDLCQLYTLTKNGIDFMLFDLILPVAVVALLIGGIFLLASGGNQQMIESGKKAITNTVIGIIIAFGSWLIIATIVNTLGYTGFTAAWNEPPTCKQSLAGTDPPPGGAPSKKFCVTPSASSGAPATCQDLGDEQACLTGCAAGGTCKSSCPGASPPPGGLTHDAAKQKLTEAGITISSTGSCSDRSNPTCTSLDGVRQSTIDGIISFKQECGCSVEVTGGTETGHSTTGACTHGSGCKLDVSPNATLNNHVQSSYENIGQCFQAASVCYRSPTGQIWARESNHWDVAFP